MDPSERVLRFKAFCLRVLTRSTSGSSLGELEAYSLAGLGRVTDIFQRLTLEQKTVRAIDGIVPDRSHQQTIAAAEIVIASHGGTQEDVLAIRKSMLDESVRKEQKEQARVAGRDERFVMLAQVRASSRALRLFVRNLETTKYRMLHKADVLVGRGPDGRRVQEQIEAAFGEILMKAIQLDSVD